MKIEQDRLDAELVLRPIGRIDATSAAAFEAAVVAALAEQQPLALDLSQVPYVSSACLRVFVFAAKRLHAAGRELRVFRIAPTVLSVLRLSGFDTFLRIEP